MLIGCPMPQAVVDELVVKVPEHAASCPFSSKLCGLCIFAEPNSYVATSTGRDPRRSAAGLPAYASSRCCCYVLNHPSSPSSSSTSFSPFPCPCAPILFLHRAPLSSFPGHWSSLGHFSSRMVCMRFHLSTSFPLSRATPLSAPTSSCCCFSLSGHSFCPIWQVHPSISSPSPIATSHSRARPPP